MIHRLDRVLPAPRGKPARAGADATQRESRAIAADPTVWTPDLARQTVRRYAELAPVWDGERGGYRHVPLADALARGGPFPTAGACLEIGSGTGLLTPLLAAVWPTVISLDLSPDMLARSTARHRVRADAARAPLAGGRAAAVVLADAPLFAGEVVRLLADDGVLVWTNALGADAPHHVPLAAVRSALAAASGGAWSAVTADAGWGSWAVLRRATGREGF